MNSLSSIDHLKTVKIILEKEIKLICGDRAKRNSEFIDITTKASNLLKKNINEILKQHLELMINNCLITMKNRSSTVCEHIIKDLVKKFMHVDRNDEMDDLNFISTNPIIMRNNIWSI